MNILKISAVILFLALSSGATSTFAAAEEAAAVVSPNETISHIEKALVEISKSDFNAAQLHLKAARAASAQITGNPNSVKLANDSIIQAQVQSKLGNVANATNELNKALELYKSL